ncbi:MAG: DUF805 domain-containing protein [Pseudomonadota bacterium]
MEWMILPLKKYAQFSGRSRRKEFWMWVLFVILVMIALSIVDAMLGLGGSARTSSATMEPGVTGFGGAAGVTGGVLTTIFSLAILIPNLAVQVRRLHDTDRSGWWVLLPVVPYVIGIVLMLGGAAGGLAAGGVTAAAGGALAVGGVMMLIGAICGLVVLVFMCLDGTRGPNRFGPDPKNPEANLDEVFS